jgi:small conductance mechanosensitive channel
MDTEEIVEYFSSNEFYDFILSVGTNLIVAIVVLFIGFKLAKIVSSGIVKILEKRESDPGLKTFLKSLTSNLIKLLTVITVFTQLGVEMTSFIAILGAAGFAIGMAFSGTLGNLAGGVMILVFKNPSK